MYTGSITRILPDCLKKAKCARSDEVNNNGRIDIADIVWLFNHL
jgi:hypothetical protein